MSQPDDTPDYETDKLDASYATAESAIKYAMMRSLCRKFETELAAHQKRVSEAKGELPKPYVFSATCSDGTITLTGDVVTKHAAEHLRDTATTLIAAANRRVAEERAKAFAECVEICDLDSILDWVGGSTGSAKGTAMRIKAAIEKKGRS